MTREKIRKKGSEGSEGSASRLWKPELAFERARVAYRYVAANFPDEADLEVLALYTSAAHEAERAGDWPAYEEALRELMRAARAEAMRAKAGAA
jgi:hypothetical protein